MKLKSKTLALGKMFSTAIAGLLVVALGLPLVNAQGAATGGQGLEISPPLIEINTDPGKLVKFKIAVRNVTQGPLLVKSEIDDFVPQGEDGQAKVIVDNAAEASPYSFKSWARDIGDVTIPAQKSKKVQVILDVPRDASPGGHYGVVRFGGEVPQVKDTGVALSASLGTLVLINVSGDVSRSLAVEEFYTAQNGRPSSFFETGPLALVLRLKDNGNVHEKPIGTIRVTNGFGRETAVLPINQAGGNILPGSIRRFEQQLNKKWLFGKYKAELNVQYSGKNLSSSLSFWVIPYKLISIALAAIVLLVWLAKKGIRKYNRHIINKGQR